MEKSGDYTGAVGIKICVACEAAIAGKPTPTGGMHSKGGSGLARDEAVTGSDELQSSFFINPANAANGLCVALAIVGLLVEPSPKYCWSV